MKAFYKDNLIDLSLNEMKAISGGDGLSRITKAICWILGVGFTNPARMAQHGASPMDIQAFK